MAQKESILRIIDNSGVLSIRCIGFNGEFKKSYASINQTIKASVRSIRLGNKTKSDLKKGSKTRALVVATRKASSRSSGFFFRSNQLDAVLLNNSDGRPSATKIRGLLPKELRKTGNSRLLSISLGVL